LLVAVISCNLDIMSIFDNTSGFNPAPWLQEKTLISLQTAVQLIDLANEPDTTPWYRRKLLEIGERLIGRLVPIVALVHDAGEEAVSSDVWRPILRGGSFALGRWCKTFGVADPNEVAFAAIKEPVSDEEANEKAEEIVQEPFEGDEIACNMRKLEIYGAMMNRLLYDKLTRNAQRLLLWLLKNLWLSEFPDVVYVSRKFLPTDVNLSIDETKNAYRELHERELIERIESLAKEKSDGLPLRLVVQGVNDSRHPTPFREEQFGFPGARIAGKLTIGNIVTISLTGTLLRAGKQWFSEKRNIQELREYLQQQLGKDRVYINSAEIKIKDDKPIVFINLRHAMDDNDTDLHKTIRSTVEEWLRDQLVK